MFSLIKNESWGLEDDPAAAFGSRRSVSPNRLSSHHRDHRKHCVCPSFHLPQHSLSMASTTSPPSAQVVGNMFVEQYYSILHHKPEEVFKFYKDSSIMSRPGDDDVMISVTTMQFIDETVKSLDYGSYKVVITTVDAQYSHKDGVIVLVTGSLTGKEATPQKFTQTFFLAPQENSGFFVRNDIFRYVSDGDAQEVINVPTDPVTETTADAPVEDISEPSVVEAKPESDPSCLLPEENPKGNDEAPLENDGSVNDANTSVNTTAPDVEVITSEAEVQEDAPKKSYASIVKVAKGNVVSSPVSAPVVKPRSVRVVEKPTPAAASPVPPADTPVTNGNNAPEHVIPPEDVEGYSIYIRNLPHNATPSQLEGEFRKFGSIKLGGVQVRNHKQYGYCFGFVEFESVASMQAALEASPVNIAGRQAVVEEKRTTTRVGTGSNGSTVPSGRGRFPMVRGGFRGDGGFRGGRGGYGGGQGGGNYGRNEFRNRGDFPNRGGGRGGGRSNDGGYQRSGRPNMMAAGVSA